MGTTDARLVHLTSVALVPLTLGFVWLMVDLLRKDYNGVRAELTRPVPAILLLVNRFVPLALTLLAPIIINIVLFHTLMAPEGLPMAVTVTVLWIVEALSFRATFAGLLQARVQNESRA